MQGHRGSAMRPHTFPFLQIKSCHKFNSRKKTRERKQTNKTKTEKHVFHENSGLRMTMWGFHWSQTSCESSKYSLVIKKVKTTLTSIQRSIEGIQLIKAQFSPNFYWYKLSFFFLFLFRKHQDTQWAYQTVLNIMNTKAVLYDLVCANSDSFNGKKNALKKELLKSEFDFLMQDHIQSIHSMKILKVSQFLAT